MANAFPALLLLSALSCLTGCCSIKRVNLPDLPPGRYVSVGGHQLFIRQTGEGPNVVLLHGLGDSSLGWQFIEPALIEAGYRVTVWDTLGAGRSDKPARANYSIYGHVQRLESLLSLLNIRDAIVVGHSLGGSEALLFTERNPDAVRALCLIDPAAYRKGATGTRWFYNTPLLAQIILGATPAPCLARMALERNFHNHHAITDSLYAMYLREAQREGARSAFLSQEHQVIPQHPSVYEQAHRMIQKPTLILWGEKDKLIPLAQGERLAKDIAGSHLVILPNIGHAPPLEAPQSVLDHLLPFLKENSP